MSSVYFYKGDVYLVDDKTYHATAVIDLDVFDDNCLQLSEHLTGSIETILAEAVKRYGKPNFIKVTPSGLVNFIEFHPVIEREGKSYKASVALMVKGIYEQQLTCPTWLNYKDKVEQLDDDSPLPY